MAQLTSINYHADAILNLEAELARIRRELDYIVANNPGLHIPSAETAAAMDAEILAALREKYPADDVQRDEAAPESWLAPCNPTVVADA